MITHNSKIIPEIIRIEPNIFCDDRGKFFEYHNIEKYKSIIGNIDFLQDNISYSKKNVIRGLHYQKKPYSQGKLVTCIIGSIFDVAVDLRIESETFKKWAGFILVEGEQVWIPPGFAHGFYVISEGAIVSYKVSGNTYFPEAERTLIWNDNEINISWNLEENTTPILSKKDSSGKSLKELLEENEI